MTPPDPLPLARQHCRPAGEGDRLADAVAAGLLEKVEGWERDGDAIQRTFTFADFHRTMAFVNAVAWVAHREDHHPDLAVGYKTCRVRYTTHSAGGLTRNDFICAARVNALR